MSRVEQLEQIVSARQEAERHSNVLDKMRAFIGEVIPTAQRPLYLPEGQTMALQTFLEAARTNPIALDFRGVPLLQYEPRFINGVIETVEDTDQRTFNKWFRWNNGDPAVQKRILNKGLGQFIIDWYSNLYSTDEPSWETLQTAHSYASKNIVTFNAHFNTIYFGIQTATIGCYAEDQFPDNQASPSAYLLN